MTFIRQLYCKIVTPELRFWLYKLLHRAEVESLKKVVYKSSKGNFSLRHYYENKCIFVHITKSAGTSLALSIFGELPYHYTAYQYRVIYGKNSFNNFYKFTFVRNPWDRLYSAFSYLKGGGWDEKDAHWAEEHLGEVDNFNQFVMQWLSEDRLDAHIHFWPQSKFICDSQNKPLIDYLGYFENITHDYKDVLKKLSLPMRELKHTNVSKRKSYVDVYTREMIDKVAELYHEDINNFGYQFNGFKRTIVVNHTFVRER